MSGYIKHGRGDVASYVVKANGYVVARATDKAAAVVARQQYLEAHRGVQATIHAIHPVSLLASGVAIHTAGSYRQVGANRLAMGGAKKVKGGKCKWGSRQKMKSRLS